MTPRLRMTVDHEAAPLATVLRFAVELRDAYGLPGRIYVTDGEYASAFAEPGEPESVLLQRVAEGGWEPMRVMLPELAVPGRSVWIDLCLRPVGGIVGTANPEDAAFLEELSNLWYAVIGRRTLALYSGELRTREREHAPRTRLALEPSPARLHRGLHFLLGLAFAGGARACSLEAHLLGPAAVVTLPVAPSGVACCVRCRTDHALGLCDRLLEAPLPRVEWLGARTALGENAAVFLDAGRIALETAELAPLREGFASWERIEAEPAFDAFSRRLV